MGKMLAQYPSKSKPGKLYTVTEPNGGGDPYCDCWQWKRTRNCQHLEEYLSCNNIVPMTKQGNPYQKKQSETDLAIAEALA